MYSVFSVPHAFLYQSHAFCMHQVLTHFRSKEVEISANEEDGYVRLRVRLALEE